MFIEIYMNCRMVINLINKHIFRLIRELHLDKTSGASELIEIALEIIKTQLNSIELAAMLRNIRSEWQRYYRCWN